MNEKKINQITAQRLAFIKYLFNIAIEQSRKPEPISAISVLTFHDSIELFLYLACEHLGINTPKNSHFLDYWELLKPKIQGEGITQKAAMSRLNTSRNSLKHQGILPTKQDIEGFRESAMNFFIENTPRVFHDNFENISMINLVIYEEARQHLQKAEEYRKNGKLDKGIIGIAISFQQLIKDFEKTKSNGPGYSPFCFGHDMSFESSSSMGLGLEYNPFKDYGFSRFVKNVSESIELMRKPIEVLSLGLNYKEYIRFRLLTPEIFYINGQYEYRIRSEKSTTKEDYEFCFNFVIDCAIHLQEFDYEIKI